MKLAYLNIHDYSIPFSNPYWVKIIPEKLLAFVNFDKEPVSLSHSIAGRYLLWILLKEQGLKEISDYILIQSKFGKISIKDSQIYFNISHAGDYVICAVSDFQEMGIDIELKLQVDLKDFRSIFSDIEWKLLSESVSLDSFYKLWTKKEAVCKAEGIGLMDDMFNINPDENGCIFYPTKKYWFLQELIVPSGYSCHLAVQKKETNLDLKKINP